MIPAFLKSVYKKLRPEATFILIDMSITDHFRQEVSLIDRDGNRISLRKLPDGSEFRVVKNFPSEEELRTILRRYGREILYREFDSLKRWMVILNLAQSC
jgi:demethylmenaquinone methyltransferase/2-methoxy-6-polyprenyl-1,4-benzoquinol methylase